MRIDANLFKEQPQGRMPRVVFVESKFGEARALMNPLDIKRALNGPWSQRLVFHEGAILVIGAGKKETDCMKPVRIAPEGFLKKAGLPGNEGTVARTGGREVVAENLQG